MPTNTVRTFVALPVDEAIQALAGESAGAWTVRQLHLMRSDLSPQGARHTCLEVAPLCCPEKADG
ncbi:MAG: hypothetical protein PHV34_21960 [Verrucomicrobiae bacterium]|nr:hypothetical protein [Verrucomicrobiae bacterium]